MSAVAAEDFIVKPLRVDELLDWIGRRLGLEWVSVDAPSISTELVQHPPPLILPGWQHLSALDELLTLGYYAASSTSSVKSSASIRRTGSSFASCAIWRASSSSTP